MSHYIIDRRANGRNKSAPNRKKLLDRVKGAVRDTVQDAIRNGSVADIVRGGKKVNVPMRDLSEPQIVHGEGGVVERTLPGNKNYKFNAGDTTPKPKKGGSGNGEGSASDSGDGEDSFTFELTREEFLEYFFEDLELPDLAKKKLSVTEEKKPMRNGFARDGNAANLDLMQTMKSSVGRRAALRTPKKKKLRELEAKLEAHVNQDQLGWGDNDYRCWAETKYELQQEIAILKKKMRAVPYIDDVDLRYRNWTSKPVPATSAVMFCVDRETEYLSPTGWVKIDQYRGGEVAQYQKDGSISFIQPDRYVKTPYTSSYIDIVTEGVNQRLTRNHRFVYRDKFGDIQECLSQDVHQLKGWHSKNAVITSFQYGGEGLPLSDSELKLHIAFKADGTYQQENTNRAQFCFTKTRKVERLIDILTELNLDYKITKLTDRTWIYVTTPDRISKRFDGEWFTASKSQLEIIAEEVLYWDGSVAQSNYSSSHKSDVDYIQFVWAAMGLGTRMFFNSPVWVVRFSQRNLRTLTQNTEISETLTDDDHAYCFTVPSGMLLLRRAEQIFVSGNCLMDVSGSMSQWHKDIAKRFYMLLYLFLFKHYEKVDIVYVRHHHDAEEVNEDDFFHKRTSGGTIVSKGLELVNEIIDDRYNTHHWNVYVAQSSDGDNWQDDHPATIKALNTILNKIQFFFYVDITNRSESDLWTLYSNQVSAKNFEMQRITDPSEIYPVFRKLFEQK